MKPELRENIIAYNKRVRELRTKSTDLDIIVWELLKLPPGQLKKVLTDDVLIVLKKYGYTEE